MLLDVRQRTNQENGTFVTDAELTEYLNQELAELWTRLVLNQGQPHYRSSTTVAVVPPTALYPLPADFWTLQEVTATVGGITGTLQPFMVSERGALTSEGLYATWGPARYRIQAGNIEFQPAVEAFSATIYYSPSQPRLASGADVFDGYNGYEAAAIYGACATVLAKEESDPGFYLGQKQAIYRTIDAASAHRDMSSPERVQDVSEEGVRGRFGWWG